jgi:hypothetical protein
MIRSLRVRLSLLLIFAVSLSLAGLGFYGHQQLVGELNASFATMQRSTGHPNCAERGDTPVGS